MSHAARTATLRVAAHGIQVTLLANADVMSGARRRWEAGRDQIARHLSISWADLDPRVLAARLSRIVGDVVHGLHDMIASYEDALRVVESCRHAFDRIINEVRLPEHVPASGSVVAAINGWKGTHVNQATVGAAIDAVTALTDRQTDVGMGGTSDDLEALRARFAELTPAEADAVIAGLTPSQLAALGDILKDNSPWSTDGLSTWDRLEFTGDLLGKLSSDSIARLTAAIPWLEPSFDTTEVARTGAQSQTGTSASGIHLGMPTGSLWGSGTPGVVTFGDIRQGKFNDCWAISALIAASRDNPSFIADGIRENANGTISVRLFDDSGAPRWVTVTRDLPLTSEGAVLAATAKGALWPAYYEKALAQAYTGDIGNFSTKSPFYTPPEKGSYGALEQDMQWSAVKYYTGVDSQVVITGDPAAVERAMNEGKQVLVGTRPVSPFETPPAGYVTNHVFYVHHVEQDTIVMANPWNDDPALQVRVSKADFQKWFLAPSTVDTPG
ncbi:MAG: hypothetical protein V9F04_15855 [Dermatophilaceae bacterium]